MSESKVFSNIMSCIIAAVVFFICKALFLPTMSFNSLGFLFLVGLSLLIGAGIMSFVVDANCEDNYPFIVLFGGIGFWVLMFIFAIFSSAFFNARTFHVTALNIQVAEEDSEIRIPTLEDVGNISLMDTESAKKLGDRTLGSLSKYVSQYEVSDTYYTISYQGRIVKVAPLEYGSFFKATNNWTIPGYVLVDPNTNEAEFIEVENGIKYSPSDYFSQDLKRHVHKTYSSEFLGDYSFQLDEEGNPYWIYTILDCNTLSSAKVPYGCITVDAVTGAMCKYTIDSIPQWIELVFNGEMVETLYNRYGRYINGFWNLSNTGVTATTDDYGYLQYDGDIYIYTGVTSAGADESNLGFILMNSRNGECTYYPIAGAEEYSGMAAAEGLVQNYGYLASFPSLVMVADSPTYVCVLKDSNGLVKQYAMVNYENYTIAVVADTLEDCQAKYVNVLMGKNTVIDNDSVKDGTFIISTIQFIVVEGNTICYIKTEDGSCFKQVFSSNEELILLEVGKTVDISYIDGNIKNIVKIDVK